MPLKWAGAALMLLAGILAGSGYAAQGRRTLEGLAALEDALDYIGRQIETLSTPLPALFEALADMPRFSALFADAAQALAQGAEFSRAVDALCAHIEDEKARALASGLFPELERSPAPQASALLDSARGTLALHRAEREKELRERTPLVRRIALCAGALAAILLV